MAVLIYDHLQSIKRDIAFSNNDQFKRFWNEDRYGRISFPKTEESCRDVVLDFLKIALAPTGVSVEPEGHMAKDKRADIVAVLQKLRVPIEIKRDYHADVWTALNDQLGPYTRDPGSLGFGVYCVFWFGNERRPNPIPRPPGSLSRPTSANSMEKALTSLVASERKDKTTVIVMDVSGFAESP